jgi:formylglycine-generating enzyme required for sulfatase activity
MTPPTKPTDTLPRVFRGGSWNFTTATNVRAAYRFDLTPTGRYYLIGFRCAQRGCRQQVLKVTP